MARHRTYSIEFKRQVAQEFLGGESLNGLAPSPRCFAESHPGVGGEVRVGLLRRRVPGRRPAAAVRGEVGIARGRSSWS